MKGKKGRWKLNLKKKYTQFRSGPGLRFQGYILCIFIIPLPHLYEDSAVGGGCDILRKCMYVCYVCLYLHAKGPCKAGSINVWNEKLTKNPNRQKIRFWVKAKVQKRQSWNSKSNQFWLCVLKIKSRAF